MVLFFKDPLIQVIDELNEKNKATLAEPFKPSDLTFSEASFSTVTGVRQVIARPTQGSKFFGAIKDPGITYTRYNAAKMWLGTIPKVVVSQSDNYATILDALTTAYCLPPFSIEPAAGDATKPYDFAKEVHNETIDFGGTPTKDITVSFRADSFGWYGNLTIRCYDRSRNVASLISTYDLEGLKYPDDTLGMNGSMSTLTYSVPFELPQSSYELLGRVGAVLPNAADPLVVKIVDCIMGHYSFEDVAATRASLLASVAGSVVTSTNLTVEGATPIQITIASKKHAGALFVGNLVINNPVFK